jgi:hypothetical protein
VKEIICHAWFSPTQYEITKQNIFYVTTEFNCVQVTEITEERNYSNFKDAKYLGQVYDHGIYKEYTEICTEEEKLALIAKKKELYKNN